ncbi:RNA polymerase sigma factor [Luteimonas sp. RIT-PG2_3]
MTVVTEIASSERSFERFLVQQRPILVRYLRKYVTLHDDAQDIAQESLFKLTRYRNLPAADLRPLLYRIALNALHDFRRRESGVRQIPLCDTNSDLDDVPDELPQPEQWTEHQEELARVRAAIDQLPARCKEIYLLNRVDGMSYSQISKHCGISTKAVEKNVGRALSSLRRLLSVQAGSTDSDDQNP